MKSCSLGNKVKIKYLDIGVVGKTDHQNTYALYDADVEGVAGEQYYGPLRIFKKAGDQSNASAADRTTEAEQKAMRDLTFRELAQASIGDGPVDVTAQGMPPISDLLALMKKTGS
jgi:catechol-2,3-dioxygenase